MNIESATLVKYNANSRGTRTGDCTARAISLAFNIDYSQARKALNDSAKQKYDWNYNTHDNCIKVIRELGGGELIKPEGKLLVSDFADSHIGTYIVWCSKDGTVRSVNHLVCIIDDKIYDSWDSRRYYVLGWWVIESGVHAEDITQDIQSCLLDTFITSKNYDWYREYTNDLFDKVIAKNRKLKKLKEEYKIDITLSMHISRIKMKDYNFTLIYDIEVNFNSVRISTKRYESKLGITFKPTMKQDEIMPYFNKIFYDKFYFFIHNVVDKVEDILEGDSLLGDVDRPMNSIRFWTDAERKSFNSLPYWVIQLATYFSAERISPYYSQYATRVHLTMKRPPFDNQYNEPNVSDTVTFRSPSMECLKAGLKKYKETGDYDEAYDVAGDY